MPPTRKEYARVLVRRGLRRANVKATTQAIASFTEAVLRCDPEYLGDTDTLLAGLLFSGSYAIDVLEQSGSIATASSD